MLLTVMLLSATTAWAENVSYKDADGTIKYVDATVLDGSKTSLPSGCYVAKGNVSYDSGLNFGGNVQLILADGASLTVTKQNYALYVDNGSLTIYGQAQGTGQLHVSNTRGTGIWVSGTLTIYGGSVETSGTGGNGISAEGDITVNGGSVKNEATNGDGIFSKGNITVNGGSVKAKVNDSYGNGIFVDGNITLNGGSVEAEATNSTGISANGNITLNGGTVKSSSYNGTVIVADGFTYIDEDGNPYTGTLDNDNIKNKTLRPYCTTYFIDAAGTRQNVNALVLNGGTDMLPSGRYVVRGNVSYDSGLNFDGDVKLILADGASLTVNKSSGTALYVGGSLFIYGQAQGTGQLHVSSTDGDGLRANDNITIYGGSAEASSTSGTGISANGNITLNGGTVKSSSYNGTVIVADGFTYIDEDGNPYTGLLNNDNIKNKTLRPKTCTVTFDIADEDDDPEAQTVLSGRNATQPTVGTRTGYTLSGWKLGDQDYDFDTPVIDDITLTATWIPITYIVQFNANGGSGEMEPFVATYDQYEDIPSCTFTAPEGKALRGEGWNTAADGSGESFDTEHGRFWNLASEQDAVVTLYAQWGKDIAGFTATVPDQTMDTYDYIFYKFDAANSGYVETGTVVKDGDNVLQLGTDYRFKDVIYKVPRTGETMPHQLGDVCYLIIEGIGDYAGTLSAEFTIISPVTDGEWGDLAWSINTNGNFTISPKDGVEGTVAMPETTREGYPWYSRANTIKTITIGEGITTVAASAFAGTSLVSSYGNVYQLTLPESLTTIGDDAFAYCTGLSINLADLSAISYPASAFRYIGTITGILYDGADNTKTIAMMSTANTCNVTLQGRTLYKDGDWNTLCLPFSVIVGSGMMEGATAMTLNTASSGFNTATGELTLYFDDVTAGNTISGGTPFIVKWSKPDGYTADGGFDITNPVFSDITVVPSVTDVTSEDGYVSFVGNFSPVTFTDGSNSVLYLGAGNNVYWPNATMAINANRAYFQLNGITAGTPTANVRSLVLTFGDADTQPAETTAIAHTAAAITDSTGKADAWYTLDGRKLQGKPTQRGMYINNGRKVVVK